LQATNEHNLLFPKRWVYHSLFWIAYYLFAVLICLFIHHIYDPRFYWQLASLIPLDMALVYWYLFLLRRFLLNRRRIALYLPLLACGIGVIALMNISLHRLYTYQGSSFFAGHDSYNVQAFASQMLNSFYLLGLATAAKFGKDWMLQKRQLQEIEKTQVATELAFLRAQIQPHFFFNTLNNLYSLTLQKSDQAPEVVLKLSSLMSYMLYESAAPLVPLEKEVATLENYLSLEQLRFGGRLSLCFEKKGAAANVHIPPLLLLAFVENSFKHGMSQITGEGRINMLLEVQPDELTFHIDNPIVENRLRKKSAGEPGTQGIGLHNVTRRLDLLYGPRYRLDLRETATTFYVTLKLPLP
jgi:two-component system, LytTR family, sensor kinase